MQPWHLVPHLLVSLLQLGVHSLGRNVTRTDSEEVVAALRLHVSDGVGRDWVVAAPQLRSMHGPGMLPSRAVVSALNSAPQTSGVAAQGLLLITAARSNTPTTPPASRRLRLGLHISHDLSHSCVAVTA